MINQRRGNPVHPEDRELELRHRRFTHERRRVLGLLVIALIILAIVFARFGKTIPWGAR